ncbi:hypothetical protein Ddc_23584 [Ditylenchus destructor]|nr:hypothetical protein Ddc_23584 [Ditylenchus destructor]
MALGDDGLAARGLQDDESSKADADPLWELACLLPHLTVRDFESIVEGFDRFRRQAKTAQAALHALEVVDQARPARHGHAHRQHVDHHQMGNTRGQRRIDFRVFMHINRQVDRGQFRQRRLARAQGDQRCTAFTHQVGGDQQVFGTARLGNADGNVRRLQGHRRHRLHVRVAVGRCGEQQAEEFVLGIGSHRARSTKAIELDTLGLGHGGHGLLQLHRVQLLPHFHQGVQGGVEDFQAVVGDGVVFMDRELAKAGTRGQALRQLELQVLEPGATDGAAETHDGRLADAHAVRQVGHGTVHHSRRVKQHVIGNLEFRFA